MNDGDSELERDLRSTLGALASERAPDRLVSRVASIPDLEPVSSRPRFAFRFTVQRAASAAVAVVAVALIAAAAIFSRGVPAPSTGSHPSATPPPSASAPASIAPTPSATETPAASTATARPGPSGGPVDPGFAALSVTFVSPKEGFVLGTTTCAGGRCPSILRTRDAGATWASIPAPPASIAAGPATATGAGVTSIRFATPLDGWVFGPELWATHDGGATWRRVSIGGFGSVWSVVALEAARGRVHAVLYGGQQQFRLASAATGGDEWQMSAVSLPVGAGPVPTVQLVLSGTGGWAIENDRTVVAGARLAGAGWEPWTPPCKDVVGPAVLAASSSLHVVAACNVGLWSTPQGEHLYVSDDGGSTFRQAGAQIPMDVQQITAASPTTMVVGGSGSSGGLLVGSFDGGRTWSPLTRPATVTFADLGFTTTSQGIVIEASGSGGRLLMTRDGGRTWSPVGFVGGGQ